MPFAEYSEFSTHFLQAMVQTMYQHEARLINTMELLCGSDLNDFYLSYMACPYPGRKSVDDSEP